MKRNRLSKWLGWPLLAALILLGGTVSPLAAGEIGKTIDKTNVQDYKDVLFPALYQAVERGDFTLPTTNLAFEYKHDPRFLAAGEKNAGKFDVNPEGDLIEKGTAATSHSAGNWNIYTKHTGKIPNYNIYGFPFPHIDRNDPNIALKIMWNFMYMKYRFMAFRTKGRMSWISQKGGEDRWLGGAPESQLFFQGREPGQEIKNPDNYLSMELQPIEAPMSMKGLSMMSWAYFDERDIAQFAYVPAFRRVRQTSGAARSDPYQGTDAWLDLNYMWSGKNRTMKWRLLGERTILVPFTSLKKDTLEEESDGSVHPRFVASKWGFKIPGWKGAKWAPTSVSWVPRQVWVIEQIPKDPYYAWGVHTNYVDKETYVIWAKEVNDKAGQSRIWVLYLQHYGEAPSGHNTIGYYDALLVIDKIVRHATLTERVPYSDARLFMPAYRLGPEFFTQSNFLQLSK